MKQFVLSGINLYEGGPLSIYYDCLDSILEKKLDDIFEIVAFVHKKDLFSAYEGRVKVIELPKSRKSYLVRLFYEFVYFYNYSKKHNVEIWLSLHDITPRVKARKLYTYCHNVSPFVEKDLANVRYSVTNVLFSYFYKYIYRINIKSATAIIVQTDWMRKAFLEMYPVHEVIVARPELEELYKYNGWKRRSAIEKKIFIYPVYPRYFKNFEVICEAAKLVDPDKCEIILTLNGNENQYAKEIFNKFKSIEAIKWIGLVPREKVFEIYDMADCLIFSSKMETWGLPISEFKKTGKDIILVDLPYARETLGEYQKVMFFPLKDALKLGNLINAVVEGKQEYTPNNAITINPPFVRGWNELIDYICC